MSNSLCPCSKLDWSGFDMTQPHHPDCESQELPEWFKKNEFAISKGRPVYENFVDNIPMKTTTVQWNDEEAKPYYKLYCYHHGLYYEGFEQTQECQHCQQVEIDAPPVGGFDLIPFGAIPFDGSPDHLYIRLTDGNGNHSPAYRINIKPTEEDAEDLNSAPWIYPAQAPQLIERRIHLATLAANPDWCISIPIKNAPGYPIKSVNLWRKKEGDKDFTMIASNLSLPTIFTDYSVSKGVFYRYELEFHA